MWQIYTSNVLPHKKFFEYGLTDFCCNFKNGENKRIEPNLRHEF